MLEAQSQQVFEVTFLLWKVSRFWHHVTLTSCFIYQTCQAGYTAVASMLLAAEVNTGGGRTAWGWIGEQGKFLLACSLYFWLSFNLTLLFTAPRAVWHSPFAWENTGKWERRGTGGRLCGQGKPSISSVLMCWLTLFLFIHSNTLWCLLWGTVFTVPQFDRSQCGIPTLPHLIRHSHTHWQRSDAAV